MNSRIAVLENVDYLPIETASISVLLGVLSKVNNIKRKFTTSINILLTRK